MVAFGRLKLRHVRLIAISIVLYYIYATFKYHSNRTSNSESVWTESLPPESSTQIPNNLSFSAQVSIARESSRYAAKQHSRTLGTGALFVISLKRVESRRQQMDVLAKALDLDFTYINATDAQSSGVYGLQRVERIINRVRWQRDRLDEKDLEDGSLDADFHPRTSENYPNYVLDAFPFKWSNDAMDNFADPLANELGISGSDYWTLELDRFDSGEGLDEAMAWEVANPMPAHWLHESWKQSSEAVVIHASVRNNLQMSDHLSLGGVACADSHVRAIREIIRRKLDSAIIFQDDIDIEFSIERILQHEWPFLPPTWDIVYLGHCWSSTEPFQPFLDPKATYLRKTQHALCLHAHAVSLRGAYKLARFLRSPDYAYSRPIDHLIKDLVQMHYLESYTFVPALVVQTKKEESQIKVGQMNSAWKDVSGEWLVDSTKERIALVGGGFDESG